MPADYELSKLNSIIAMVFDDNENYISDDIVDFLTSKSKRIRAKLIFLLSKALNYDITDKIYNLACAVELIHNATLIHDDIIDDAKIRREKVSLNCKLGNNLSVLSGDILLTRALKEISKCDNIQILNIFADCLYNMCKGEINQHFLINYLPKIEEYIKKSEYKTAELFKAALVSLVYIQNPREKNSTDGSCNKATENVTQLNNIADFALNFGIAFQIKDDLLNIINSDVTKPIFNDIQNGIYTAPVIFLNEDKKIENMNKEEIIKSVKNEKYIQKTLDLIKKYVILAVRAINFIPDNEYKQEIIKITENMYRININE